MQITDRQHILLINPLFSFTTYQSINQPPTHPPTHHHLINAPTFETLLLLTQPFLVNNSLHSINSKQTKLVGSVQFKFNFLHTNWIRQIPNGYTVISIGL